MYTVAELFCGCGGFSEGFIRSGRFDVVLGNDVKPAALRTFAINHTTNRGAPEIILGDIRLTSTNTILEAFARKGIRPGELDCLIGGPPCQGFSQLRRGETRRDNEIVNFTGYNRLDEDPRNDLVLRFLEIAEILQPKFIVIENVPQMKRHSHNGKLGGLTENIKILLHEMHYNVEERKVNAANYGVPQLRERLFFLASRVCKASFPAQTHVDVESLNPKKLDNLLINYRQWVTVADAISDLPSPSMGPTDKFGGQGLEHYPERPISEFAARMRSNVSFPYNHVTRTYNDKLLRIIREMQPGETWDHATMRVRQCYEQLIAANREPGEERKTTLERLTSQGIIEPTFYKDYYWSAYTRLAWDRSALTITANANYLGSGRFTHPEKDRGITMREAARLQSFPDDFRFFTSPERDTETDQANNSDEKNRVGVGLDMIGEAVPPLLAEAIARHIASLLDKANAEPALEIAAEVIHSL